MERVFLDPLEPTSWLHELVRSAIARITAQNFGARLGNSGCIFVDIGEYLVCLVRMLSELAQQLSQGRHIEIYSERRLREMERDDDFSMLDPIDYMSDQYRNLKHMSSMLEKASTSIKEVWRQSPKSCFKRPETFVPESPRRATTSYSSARSPVSFDLPSRPSPRHTSDPGIHPDMRLLPRKTPAEVAISPQNTQISFQNPNYSNLERRGKQNDWTCPHGRDCRHGGVTVDGELVKFSQHSAIRAHMDKHERPWKCHLPNCPNLEGFARKDQLERHQRHVFHGR